MSDTNKMALAKTVYEDLCASLDKRDWHYTKHDENLSISFGVSSEDLPMSFFMVVDADRQLISLFSRLPFTVPEDKRMELAIATCVASDRLVDGSFDYDIVKGVIDFRLTASFRESKIGDGLFKYLIDCSCNTVDEYNDKFFAIAKDMLSINEFIEKEYKD